MIATGQREQMDRCFSSRPAPAAIDRSDGCTAAGLAPWARARPAAATRAAGGECVPTARPAVRTPPTAPQSAALSARARGALRGSAWAGPARHCAAAHHADPVSAGRRRRLPVAYLGFHEDMAQYFFHLHCNSV